MSKNFDFSSVFAASFRDGCEEIQEKLDKSLADIATLSKMMFDEFAKVGFDKDQATALTIEWVKAANIAAAIQRRGNR
ncbi:MAG: hypothetical protein IKD72_00030 [Clostridia bacterium]|nr:hypothetical protein [Clostridia bacterium]